MRKIKLLSVSVVFYLFTILVAGFPSVSAAATATDPKETFINAIKSMQNAGSSHMNFDLSVSLPQVNNMDISAKGEYDVQEKPMLGKMTMNLSMKDGTRKFEQDFIFYLEEAENQILCYSNENKQWLKRSLPKNNSDQQSEEYLNAIKVVTLKSEDGNARIFEVTVDMNYIKENIRQKTTTLNVPNSKLIFNIFDSIDDFTYLVTIDKKTSDISKIEMDLSDWTSKIVKNMADSQSGSSEQKDRFKEMFANMKVNVAIAFSKNMGTIDIPEEVKSQAKEVIPYSPGSRITPKVIEQTPAVYPTEARAEGLEGRVLLRVNVSDTGTVTYASILQSSGYEILDNAAVASVTKWRFMPAQMNGKAVSNNIIIPVSFQLGDSRVLDYTEIVNMQRKLNELGFDCGEPDGVIGPKTEQAIKDFQQSRGLPPDGIAGPETKKALGI